MMVKEEISNIEIGVVGLGLMGSSIIVALLNSGHRVVAIAPIPEDIQQAEDRILSQLAYCRKTGICSFSETDSLTISEDYKLLANCDLVLECVIEDIQIKASVYQKIAAVVSTDTIIASNTSAIEISLLQKQLPQPERFLGVHWAEPAFATRFMEITCGTQTDIEKAEWVFRLAHHWGKEPTLLRKDIRGFITNRLMYAVYRELFHLLESKCASMESVDKAFRYDAGSWMTLMGIFRRIDFSGFREFAAIYERIGPTLSNKHDVPELMKRVLQEKARGIYSAKGLYEYSPEEAKAWEEAFALFNKDIYQLASQYPLSKKLELKDAD